MVDGLRHAYADVDGIRLHWAELGERSSHAPLVLLHGIGDSHLSWRPVVASLARDRLVLMPDLPGCGLSGRPNVSYELASQAKVMAHWLAQLGLGSVDIVGHSYGGGVAQMLLLECPERIRRMILVASGGLGRGLGFWLKFASFPRAVEHWGQPFMAFGTRRSLRRSLAEPRAAPLQDAIASEDVDDVLALARMNAEPGTARAFSRMVRDVINWRGQTRLFLQHAYEIEVFPPIAVFWGERDHLIPIVQGEQFAALMQGVRFQRFPDCGHYVHRDQPAAFVAATRAFFDDPHVQPARLPRRNEASVLGSRAEPNAANAKSRGVDAILASLPPLQRAYHALQTLRARLQRPASGARESVANSRAGAG
jgi:pimeloyl-ACP methyl ester carboxylesterase